MPGSFIGRQRGWHGTGLGTAFVDFPDTQSVAAGLEPDIGRVSPERHVDPPNGGCGVGIPPLEGGRGVIGREQGSVGRVVDCGGGERILGVERN